jgi:hypothetical protein
MITRRRLLVAALFLVGLLSVLLLPRWGSEQALPSAASAGAEKSSQASSASPAPVQGEVSSPLTPNTAAAQKTAPRVAELRARIEPFQNWLLAWHRGEVQTEALLAQAKSLAQTRRAALKELIRLDPKLALDLAVPKGLLQSLPLSLREEMESYVDATATYEVFRLCGEHSSSIERVATIDGKRYEAFSFGARLNTLSKNQLPLHGIAIDDQLAFSDKPYRILDQEKHSALNAVPKEGQGPLLQVGASLKSFSSDGDFTEWVRAMALAEQAPGPDNLNLSPSIQAATDTTWINGEKRVLWMITRFSDDTSDPISPTQIATCMESVNSFYLDVSRSLSSFKATVVPVTFKLSQPMAYYAAKTRSYEDIRTEIVAAAKAYDRANGNTGLYDPDTYDRWIIPFNEVSGANYNWAGLALVGAKSLWLNGFATKTSVVAHELGHNQGLDHSRKWVPSGSSPIGAGSAEEYGDGFDVMGDGELPQGHFNAKQKSILSYLKSTEISIPSSSGTYRIRASDARDASGIQVLQLKAGTSYDYWFELRHQNPASSDFFVNERSKSGVLVHWGKAPPITGSNDGGTYLLQMEKSGTRSLSELVLNQSFTDTSYGFTVTPVAMGGTGKDKWMDLSVAIGATGSNHNPSASLSVPSSIQARNTVVFNASASDPDGDTVYYRWDFGDGIIYSSGTSANKTFLRGGQQTVNLSVTDAKGGIVSKSSTVTVSDPWDSWTKRNSGITDTDLNAVIFANNKFIAVGGISALSSTDGVTWTKTITQYGISMALIDVAYTGTRYVAAGYQYESSTGKEYALVLSSADALDWRNDSPNKIETTLNSIAFGVGKIVTVGTGGRILVSSDGSSWSNVASGTTNDLNCVRYVGGYFLACGSKGTILRSSDAQNWQNVSPLSDSSFYSIAFSNGCWWVSPIASSVYMSSDASTWQRLVGDTSEGNFQVSSMLGTSSGYLVGSSWDSQVFITKDFGPVGLYKLASTAGSVQRFGGLAYGKGSLVVVGEAGVILQSGAEASGLPTSISAQPLAQSITVGSTLSLSVTATGSGTLTYQWKKDGVAISGATSASYSKSGLTTADAGLYTVVITGANGSVTSDPAKVEVTEVFNGYLAALSVRSESGPGDAMLFMGVITGDSGSGTMPVMLRGLGPQLSAALSNYLRDPLLTLNNPFTGQVLASNDDWDPALKPTLDAMYLGLTTGSKDAALQANLSDGVFTVGVGPKNTDTGVVLADIYPSSGTAPGRLKALSVRSKAGAGDSTLIVGFIISGGRARILLRGLGPVLNGVVPGFLVDPKLELIAPSTGAVLKSNDNWGGTTELSQAFSAVALGTLPADSKDAALVINLDPGLYTANLTGMNNSVGIGIVEIYQVP